MLESSEVEFTSRFAAHAAQGTLYPQLEGSPLLEFASGGRVLYLFDRSGPYAAQAGAARMVVHALLDMRAFQVLGRVDRQADNAWPPEEALTVVGVSALEGRGQVVAVERHFVVVRARLPLVLAAFEGLPELRVGDWVAFETQPPLHGFLVSALP